MADFVHLHVHTEYSLLDGVNRTGDLFEKVKEHGMGSVAISDHGVLYGVPEFWMASKDAGVKPIIGCEMYLAPGDMSVKKEIDGIRYYHLLLIAKNDIGYKNMVKLVSDSHLKGMYYKPRIDFELLKKHSEGLICTSACLAGPLARHITMNQEDKAREWLKKLHGVFGDDFYLEIQRNGVRSHDEIDEKKIRTYAENEWEDHLDMVTKQVKVNKKLYEFSDEFGIPVIATTDAHYLNEEDKDVQKVLFCIKDGKTLDDQTAMNGYMETYIKTPEELAEDFSDMPEVLLETVKIDEKIEEFDITFDRVQPQFWNMPDNTTAEKELRLQVFQGAYEKFVEDRTKEIEVSEHTPVETITDALDKELVDRLDYELKVIHEKGYDDYFLVVSDIMKWAARQDILTGVRGSVAGSAAAYCLDIVALDPIKWELYFERFLNPERPSPPDIDMDIQDSRRDELIDYVKDKYGHEAVAAICAIGRLKTKAAIRDVARVMDIDLSIADKLSKMVQVVFGKPFTFNKMMEVDPEFRRIVDADPKLQELGRIVTKIEGLSRHMSVHACGYLVTPGAIDQYTALQKESGGDRIITQWEGPWIEEIGLMKFDFLGLRTLSIISYAIDLIKERQGIDINFWDIPDGDTKTYELLGRGETVGVFQFESPPMQKYLVDLQPSTQEDLCFMAAAYRPGPMKYIPDYIDIKHGRKAPEYLVPELKEIVGMTNGFAIYQEQVIKIAVDLGGYSMGGADLLRRAMGKKKMKIMKQEEPKFKKGVMDKGYSQDVADELWNYMLPFADYGFNKAHAAGYAVLAYKCAYLKANYPLEFMTALMHADLETPDRIVIDMTEAKRMGFEILPPDINKSGVYFKPEGESGIRFGLGAIKNVGVHACERIVEEREENGEYEHFDDLVVRAGHKEVSKKVSECLIKVGALDKFGDRGQLLEILPEVYQKAQAEAKAEAIGQTGLFAMANELDGVAKTEKTPFPSTAEEVPDREKLNWEKELIGLFVSSHPLDPFRWVHVRKDFDFAERIEKYKPDTKVKIMGMFSMVKEVTTKKEGKRMAIVQIEDTSATIDGVIFPRTFDTYNELNMIEEGRPFIISGIVNERDGEKSVIVNELEPANTLREPSKIVLDIRGVTDQEVLKDMKQSLTESGTEVEILYSNGEGEKKLTRYTNLGDPKKLESLREFVVIE